MERKISQLLRAAEDCDKKSKEFDNKIKATDDAASKLLLRDFMLIWITRGRVYREVAESLAAGTSINVNLEQPGLHTKNNPLRWN